MSSISAKFSWRSALVSIRASLWAHRYFAGTVFVLAVSYFIVSGLNFHAFSQSQAAWDAPGAASIRGLAQVFGIGVLVALALSARSLLRAFDKASVGWLALAGVTGGFLVYRLLLVGLTYPGILSPDLEHMIHMITSFEITDKYSFPATLMTLAGAGLTGSITGIIALESALQLCGVYLAVSYALRSRMNLLASGALLACTDASCLRTFARPAAVYASTNFASNVAPVSKSCPLLRRLRNSRRT